MTALPVYLVVDVSASLSNDINSINEAISQFVDAARKVPLVGDLVRLAIIEFSSDAREVLPLGEITDGGSVPLLKTGGGTDYGAAFRLVRALIPRDVQTLRLSGDTPIYRPVMFFVTDGSPMDATWEQDLDELRSPEFRQRPTIIAFGIGPVDPDVLRRVGSGPGNAFLVSSRLDIGDAIRSVFEGFTSVLASTAISTIQPGRSPGTVPVSGDWVDLSSLA